MCPPGHSIPPQVTQRIQVGASLTHALHFFPLAPCGQAFCLRLIVSRKAAQRILRAKFKKIPDALAVPHGLHTFCPPHGIFIKIGDVLPDGGLILWIEICGNTAQHRSFGRRHVEGAQATQRNVAQHAHAGMMKSQADIEHNGRDAALAQAFTGFLQHPAGAAQNKLMRRVVIGYVQGGPCGAGFVDDLGICMHGHHACFAGGPCLQLRHVYGARVQNIPCHFRGQYARKTECDHFAKAVAAKKRRIQPQRSQHAPLGILQHEYVRRLPAGKADLLHTRFIHEAKNIPVRHGGNAIHGRSCCGEIIVQFAAHSGPDGPKTAAHNCQRRRAVNPLRRNPQAASFQPGKGFGIGICWQSQ